MPQKFSIPDLAPSPSQPEITIGEMMRRIGFLAAPLVESQTTTTPPGTLAENQAWLIPSGGSGAWTDKDGTVQIWTGAGFLDLAVEDGMEIQVLDQANARLRRVAGAWVAA